MLATFLASPEALHVLFAVGGAVIAYLYARSHGSGLPDSVEAALKALLGQQQIAQGHQTLGNLFGLGVALPAFPSFPGITLPSAPAVAAPHPAPTPVVAGPSGLSLTASDIANALTALLAQQRAQDAHSVLSGLVSRPAPGPVQPATPVAPTP